MIVSNHKDVGAGILITAVGLAFSLGASCYSLGSASAMGPGYVPFGLGLLLTGIGLVVMLRAFRQRPDIERIERIEPQVVLAILIPIVLFGALLDQIGLVGAIVMLVLLSSLANRDLSARQTLVSAALMALLCVVVFVVALRVQVPVLPAILRGL